MQHSASLVHLVDVVVELGASLVQSAAAGDATAFTRIVATYHRDMVRVAYTVVGDADLAADAVQSAWAIAWQRLGSHRASASLRSWLLKIAANEARQIVRRSSRRTLREIAVDGPAVLVEAPGGLDAAAHIDLSRALGRLSVDDRVLLGLRYGADLDSSEIAEILGGTASGVRTRLARLLHRLREDLDHA